MIKRMIRRCARQPLSCIGVILFAVILAVILCMLRRSQEEEQQNFEKTYHSVPVEVEITELNGSRLGEYDSIEGYMADLFFEDSLLTPDFSDLVCDVQLRMSHMAALPDGKEHESNHGSYQRSEQVVGISSTKVAEELTPDYGGIIDWFPGYGEDVLGSQEFVCIVPADYPETNEVELSFKYVERINGEYVEHEYSGTFTVVGRYTDDGNKRLYCPYSTLEDIYGQLKEPRKIQILLCRLENNDDLDLLRETAANWFAEPNPMGEPTEWGKYGNEYYPFALDIRDYLLKRLEADMQNSMTVNRIAAVLVLLLSAGAGFLTGFLVIRSRKREIALMRLLGTSNFVICVELALEQILCVILGVLLGGGYAHWEPIEQLLLFAGIYIVGLTAALLIFIRDNLLTTIKENE